MRRIFILIMFFVFSGNIAIAAESTTSSSANNINEIINRIEGKFKFLEQKKAEHKAITVEPTSINNGPELTTENKPVGSGIATGEELILDVMLKKWFLSDFFAYKSVNGAQINLGQFFSIIEFPIEIDVGARMATGWFINEGNSFDFDFSMIDGKDAKVTINGVTHSISADDIKIEDNDVYVEGNLVSEWFDLNLSYNFNALKIILHPKELLPIEQRLEREKRKKYSNTKLSSVLPWKESSYEMFSTPMVDFQMSSSTNQDNNSYSSYSVKGSHDLAYMSSSYYISGNTNDALSDGRIKFTKNIGEHGLFQNSPSAYVEVGDINGINGNSGFSRGLLLANTKTTQSNNNIISLNGDILPGWDIELYHNTILIDKMTSVRTGRYEFNNINLFFGDNTFELILYGPQGQVEHKYERHYVDRNLLTAKESAYAFSLQQLGKSVLGINDDIIFENTGWAFESRYEKGLTDYLSLKAGLSYLFNDVGEDLASYNIGANLTAFDNILLNADLYIDKNKNYNSVFSARTVLFEQSLLYEFTQTDNDFDNLGILQTTKINSSVFTLTGNATFNKHVRLSYNNTILYTANDNTVLDSKVSVSTSSLTAKNSMNLRFNKASIFNNLTWSKIQIQQQSSTQLSGSVGFTRKLGPFYTRFSSLYTVKPTPEFQTLSPELSLSITDSVYSTLKVDYSLVNKSYRTNLSTSWLTDYFSASTFANYTRKQSFNSRDTWAIGISVSFGIGYENQNNKYFFDPTSLTRKGALVARVFEDLNNNGLYDSGEPLVEGAKVKALQHRRQAVTGEDGVAVIKNMQNNKVSDIVLDQRSLYDPFLIPTTPGVALTARTAYLDHLDIPVVTSSEIDGTVYVTDKNGVEDRSSWVDIHLLNSKDEIVQKTRSEFDGYYLFTGLIPGQYHVVVADSSIKKYKLRENDGLSLDLSVQGDVLSGSDFTLEELEFSEGFVVKAGDFSTLKMLKAYWYLIKKRYRGTLKQKVFYIKNENSGKYQLNLGFYKEEVESVNACASISEIKINCTTEPYKFGF